MEAEIYKNKQELGEYIAELRDEAGLTQDELAVELDMRQSAISRVESGQRSLTLQELGSYAEFFGVSVDRLLQKEELEGSFLMRAEDADSPGSREAIQQFSEIVKDYFSAEALVW